MSLAEKNQMLFIYKNRGATAGDIICASSTLAVTFDSDHDIISHIVSVGSVSEQQIV